MNELLDLRKEVLSLGQSLQEISDSLNVIKGDLYLQTSAGVSILYCVDYYDVYRYLSAVTDSYTEESEEEILNASVRLLLFEHLEPAPVLLPWYYWEFRRHLSRLFSSASEARQRGEIWATRLKDRLSSALVEIREIVKNIEEVIGSDDPNREVEDLTAELARRVGKAGRLMQKGLKGADLVHRFSTLVERGRLLPLREALSLQDELRVTKSDVYWSALQYLKDHRHGRHEANETDALSLQCISYVNREQPDEGRNMLMYVSSAETMADVVEHLNGKILTNRDERLQIRSLSYWKVWFALALRSGVSDRFSPNDSLEYIRTEFEPKLRELRRRYLRLDSLLTIAMGRRRDFPHAPATARAFVRHVQEFMDGFTEPLLRSQWHLGVVGDILGSAAESNEDALGKLVERLEDLQLLLASKKFPITSLVSEISELLEELQRIIDNVQERLRGVEDIASDVDAGFLDDVWVRGLRLRSPFGEALEALDLGGQSRSQETRKLVEEHCEGESGFELECLILRASLALVEGDTKKAEDLLSGLSSDWAGEPEVLFRHALVARAAGDLDRAEVILRQLCSGYMDARAIIELADVLRERGECEEDGLRCNELADAVLADLVREGMPESPYIRAYFFVVQSRILRARSKGDTATRIAQEVLADLKSKLEEVLGLVTSDGKAPVLREMIQEEQRALGAATGQ